MSFATIEARLDAATTQVEVAAQLEEDIATGPASGPGSTVEVSPGVFVKTVAKAILDLETTWESLLSSIELSTYSTLTRNVTNAEAVAGKVILLNDNSSLPESEEWRFSTVIITDTGTELTGDFDLIYPNEDGPIVKFINKTAYSMRVITEDPGMAGDPNPGEPGLDIPAGDSALVKNLWSALSGDGVGIYPMGIGEAPLPGGAQNYLSWRRKNGTWGSPKYVLETVDEIKAVCNQTTVPSGPFAGETLWELPDGNYEFDFSASGGVINFGIDHFGIVPGDTVNIKAAVNLLTILVAKTFRVSGGSSVLIEGMSLNLFNGVDYNNASLVHRDAFMNSSDGGIIQDGFYRFETLGSVIRNNPIAVSTSANGFIDFTFIDVGYDGTGLFAVNSTQFDFSGITNPLQSSMKITGGLTGEDIPAGVYFGIVSGPLDNFSSVVVEGGSLVRPEDNTVSLFSGADHTDDNWTFSNSGANVQDTVVNVTMAMEGNALATVNPGATIFEKIAGVTDINDSAQGFRQFTDMEVVYTKFTPHSGNGSMYSSLSKVGGGTMDIISSVWKNGQQILVGAVPIQMPTEISGFAAVSLGFSINARSVTMQFDFVAGQSVLRWPNSIQAGEYDQLEVGQTLYDATGGGNVDTGFKIADLGQITLTADTTNASPTLTNVTDTIGELAAISRDLQFTGDTSNGSNAITNVVDVVGTLEELKRGQPIVAAGVPGGTVVASVDTVANTIYLTANATATAAGITVDAQGHEITGPGIPASTRVTNFDDGANTITMSNNAVATAAGVTVVVDATETVILDSPATTTVTQEVATFGDTFTGVVAGDVGEGSNTVTKTLQLLIV